MTGKIKKVLVHPQPRARFPRQPFPSRGRDAPRGSDPAGPGRSPRGSRAAVEAAKGHVRAALREPRPSQSCGPAASPGPSPDRAAARRPPPPRRARIPALRRRGGGAGVRVGPGSGLRSGGRPRGLGRRPGPVRSAVGRASPDWRGGGAGRAAGSAGRTRRPYLVRDAENPHLGAALSAQLPASGSGRGGSARAAAGRGAPGPAHRRGAADTAGPQRRRRPLPPPAPAAVRGRGRAAGVVAPIGPGRGKASAGTGRPGPGKGRRGAPGTWGSGAAAAGRGRGARGASFASPSRAERPRQLPIIRPAPHWPPVGFPAGGRGCHRGTPAASGPVRGRG